MRCAIVLALAGGLLLTAARAGDEKEKNGKQLLKVEGKLGADDPKDKLLKGSPHKVHEMKMKADTIYVIDLSSKDFDAVLRLENSEGRQLAINDDFEPGKSLDSRIVFKAPKDDAYKIIATCLDGKPGAYLLTVRKGTIEDLAKADPFFNMIGKPATNLVGEFTTNGEPKKLDELKGKVVMLDFWAVWCGPCIATFPHLREWHKEYGKDLEIVGVTTYFEQFGFDKEKGTLKRVGKLVKDETTGKVKVEGGLKPAEEQDVVKDFLAHHKLAHRIMMVNRAGWQKASKDYRITGIPHAVLIDRKGMVRMVRVGATPANAEDLHAEIKKLVAEK
jgi:thiol-disulfide isomerase/thioredoxin